MNKYDGPRDPVEIIGTKIASDLSPGDKVYFPGTGLSKTVHSTDHHASLVIREATEDDRGLVYGEGVHVRWNPPHNKLNWYTSKNTELVVVA
jgi:hypothetical protein